MPEGFVLGKGEVGSWGSSAGLVRLSHLCLWVRPVRWPAWQVAVGSAEGAPSFWERKLGRAQQPVRDSPRLGPQWGPAGRLASTAQSRGSLAAGEEPTWGPETLASPTVLPAGRSVAQSHGWAGGAGEPA